MTAADRQFDPVPDDDFALTAVESCVVPYRWYAPSSYEYLSHPIIHAFLISMVIFALVYIPFILLALAVFGLAEGKMSSVISLGAMFFLATLSLHVLYNFKLGNLVLGRDRLQFPISNLLELNGKLGRKWSEINEVSICKGPRNFYGILGHVLSFGFVNGERANIELWKVPVENLAELATGLKQYCPQLADDALISQLMSCHLSEIAHPRSYSLKRFALKKLPQERTMTLFPPLGHDALSERGISIIRPVSSGGAGAVYEATLDRKGPCLVFQYLMTGYDEDERQLHVAAMRSRGQILERLGKETLVNIFETFESERSFFVVTEPIAGECLRELVNKRKALPERKAVEIMRKALGVVSGLHEMESPVVLGSLSPESIYVHSTGAVFVLPITGPVLDGSMDVSTIGGRMAYAAPEQLVGAPVAQSDVYALGAILFFMLTGEDPDSMRRLQPRVLKKISIALDGIVAQATEPNQENRIASAVEFIEKLNECGL